MYLFLKACYWDDATQTLNLTKQLMPTDIRSIADEHLEILGQVDREEYDIMPHHVTLIMELCDGGENLTPAETYPDGTPLIEKH